MKGVGELSPIGFLYPSFANGMAGDWAKDFAGINAQLQQLRMTVGIGPDRSGNGWRVESAGAVVMSTDATNGMKNHPPIWPACLATQTCDWNDPLTNAWNDMFRRCAQGALHTALGACEGGDATAETNLLRWRIEAAMWLAATMTGSVPQGMFDAPMPAVTFPNTTDINHCSPIAHVFANANFDNAGGMSLPTTGPAGATSGELAALSEDHPPTGIDVGFHDWGARAAEELPLDLRLAYLGAKKGDCQDNNAYNAQIWGSNVAGASDFTNLADFFARKLAFSGVGKDSLDASAVDAIAERLDGASCYGPVGDLATTSAYEGGLSPGWLQGLVAALKTQQSGSSDMRAPFFRTDDDDWYPWQNTFVWNGSSFVEQSLKDGKDPNYNVTSRPRDQWFDDSALQYHWHDTDASGTTYRNTRVWYNLGFDEPSWWGQDAWFKEDRLATRNAPSRRIRAGLNAMAPNGDCGAAWQFTQAVALACVATVGITDSLTWPDPPTDLHTIDDLTRLEGWYRETGTQQKERLGRLYLENVPAVAIASFDAQRVSTGGTGGDVGKGVLAIQNAMLDILKQWVVVGAQMDDLTLKIHETRVAIDGIIVAGDINFANLSIERLQTEKDVVVEVANAVKGFFNLGDSPNLIGPIAGAAGAAGAVAIDGLILHELDNEKGDLVRQRADQIEQSFIDLEKSVQADSLAIKDAMTQVQQDVAAVDSATIDLQNVRNGVAYSIGKAAGLGVWNCGSPDHPAECQSHVNTVLNRRYAAYALRYKSALREAKALAYMARRAIEQRIGLHLDGITDSVGPLEPPKSWAEDVCHLTGVDYKSLRQALPLDAGTAAQAQLDQTEATEFADQFVGDYVRKLTDFVNYYNLKYPAHAGTDTAVLSVRENVIARGGACAAPSYNLLHNSGHLNFTVPAGVSQAGWQKHVANGSDPFVLSNLSVAGLSLPSDASGGGTAWLRMAPLATQSGALESQNTGAVSGPAGLVSQQVTLGPGHYALSWWDVALDANGATTAKSLGDYRVTVFDPSWNVAGSFNGAPSVSASSGAAPTWSARHVIAFDVPSSAAYRVAFGASISPMLAGSVAIADVQLEALATGGATRDYEDTDSLGQVRLSACSASADDLRGAFVRSCDATGTCWWELASPIFIDTSAFAVNGHSLIGKLASGNFNFRHVDVAVNLVGTAVRDCTGSPTPDCYGSAYLEYSLDHNGDDVGVLGFDGTAQTFDFGVATIAHAKALTAERYITMPLSSDDQSLLNQNGILKPELRGRPIDGLYQLRIYDSPALRWENLQDIQIVLNYRYWSRVATPGQF
jgi:hypothetical protein